MIRNLKIAIRSALVFGLFGFVVLSLGAFSFIQLDKLNSMLDTVASRRTPALFNASELRRQILRVHISLFELSESAEPIKRMEIQQSVNDRRDSIEKILLEMSGQVYSNEAKTLFENIRGKVLNYINNTPKLLGLVHENKKFEISDFKHSVLTPELNLLARELDVFVEYQLRMTEEARNLAFSTYKVSRAAIISGIILTLLATAILAFIYSRSLVIPLRHAVNIARQVADGDLTQKIIDRHPDEAGEMLQALNTMQENLRQTLSLITESSQQLATTAEELSVVTNQATAAVVQQSDQLEQAATAVNELTFAIDEVARNASSTSDNAEVADDKTKQGQAKINDSIKTIEALTNDIQLSSSSVTKLALNIQNIGSVLDVIRAIADQTNLLALNAAIEAARAGETGRGFAVVADEVRALAYRTQESTKEIEQMIKAVQNETNCAVENMDKSNLRAEETLRVANDAGLAFSEITKLIGQINEQNLTIASAAEEQATVAKEVDKNLVYIRDISMQTASGANQTNASSMELAKLAEQLNELVTRFKV